MTMGSKKNNTKSEIPDERDIHGRNIWSRRPLFK
jgi:hypothetical protein